MSYSLTIKLVVLQFCVTIFNMIKKILLFLPYFCVNSMMSKTSTDYDCHDLEILLRKETEKILNLLSPSNQKYIESKFHEDNDPFLDYDTIEKHGIVYKIHQIIILLENKNINIEQYLKSNEIPFNELRYSSQYEKHVLLNRVNEAYNKEFDRLCNSINK